MSEVALRLEDEAKRLARVFVREGEWLVLLPRRVEVAKEVVNSVDVVGLLALEVAHLDGYVAHLGALAVHVVLEQAFPAPHERLVESFDATEIEKRDATL